MPTPKVPLRYQLGRGDRLKRAADAFEFRRPLVRSGQKTSRKSICTTVHVNMFWLRRTTLTSTLRPSEQGGRPGTPLAQKLTPLARKLIPLAHKLGPRAQKCEQGGSAFEPGGSPGSAFDQGGVRFDRLNSKASAARLSRSPRPN